MLSRISAVVLALIFSSAAPVHAQTEASEVGTVTDESKGVLPGVTVTATDLATGRQFFGVTDERGDYRLPSMAAGRYRMQAELTGFATVVEEGIIAAWPNEIAGGEV
jgi:hypothetical protein